MTGCHVLYCTLTKNNQMHVELRMIHAAIMRTHLDGCFPQHAKQSRGNILRFLTLFVVSIPHDWQQKYVVSQDLFASLASLERVLEAVK